MSPIKLITIPQPVVMDAAVNGVTLVDRSGLNGDRWVANVEVTYDGQRHVVKADGASAEEAQVRALALAVKQALPKPVLDELLAEA